MKNVADLPIARLSGVIETEGETSACSLVFVLKTESGCTLNLNYGLMMEALRFAQEQAIIKPLSEHWWARTGKYNGCAF